MPLTTPRVPITSKLPEFGTTIFAVMGREYPEGSLPGERVGSAR